MTSKRIGLVTGGLFAGALLLGTAGFAAAKDPTTPPTPSPTVVGPGGQMGGQMGPGQMGAGMMGGQMGAGMMSGQMGAGMMGTLTGAQLEQMIALHDQMLATGECDEAKMHALHAQVTAYR